VILREALRLAQTSGKPITHIARELGISDTLVVLTPEQSGKVKRQRNNPRVEIRPSNRAGKVADERQPVTGMAEIVTDAATAARLTRIIQKKYGWEYHIIMFIERIIARWQKSRTILRITPTAPLDIVD
jgi:uncharacterized protein